MKQFFSGVITTVVIMMLSAVGYLKLGFAEVRADATPPSWERVLMSSAVHASVRREAPEIPNPVVPTDENLIAGAKQYRAQCSWCHGLPGRHSTQMQSPFYPPPPQFPELGTEYSEAQIFWITKHGIRRTGMYATGGWNSDIALWNLAAYVKRMNALPPRVREESERN